MSLTVCLCANTLYYPEGGGHLWEYLNFALGLRGLGCELVWLELVSPTTPPEQVQKHVASLNARLERYGLADRVVLSSWTCEPLSMDAVEGTLDLEAAFEADLLLSLQYDLLPGVVEGFRRSALLDIDPGLLQVWVSKGQVSLARYDVYFTTGETVGRHDARFPNLGIEWLYTAPCVALDWWTPHAAPPDASFTTVVHWFASAWMGDEAEPDDKRGGFLPYLDLPRRTTQALELAVNLGGHDEEQVIAERAALTERGWRVRDPYLVASTPWDYQRYIQESRGEFSCAKPSCLRLQNAWISNRTLCYLASAKPAIVQHTGPSRFLPDAAGLFRFRTLDEAADSLEKAATDYQAQCRLSRALAEEHFDARTVMRRLLERALA